MTTKILLDAGPSTRGWHFYESFLRCPQLWAYQYRVNKQTPERPTAPRDPLIKGSLVHVALAHHYGRQAARNGGLRWETMRDGAKHVETITDPERLYTPQEAPRELAWRQGEWEPAWTKHLVLVAAIVQAYLARYAAEDEGCRVLAVEQEMRIEVDGALFTQRADLIMEDAQGRIFIDDHKTASQVSNGKTLTRYTLSGQMLGYRMFGQRLFGDRFGGVRINLVGTVPPFQVKRLRTEAAPWAQTKILDSIRWANEQIAALKDRDPMNYPKVLSENVCIGPYGLCDHWDTCRWGKSAGGRET